MGKQSDDDLPHERSPRTPTSMGRKTCMIPRGCVFRVGAEGRRAEDPGGDQSSLLFISTRR